MQCPFCHTEIDSGEVVCPSCGAMHITCASPAGVLVGWVGVTCLVCLACVWAAALMFPMLGADMQNFPWVGLVLCTAGSIGMLWYSISTRKLRWTAP
ncbi:MAG: hypothetical protein LBG66_05690 [Gallionellaceae bacterium]|nr:hypothetical protein [Gallionellaceae bacterium]